MSFKLPRYSELKNARVVTDFHMHSTWTDGKGTVEQNVQAAREFGLKQIAITDHIRRTSDYYPDYLKAIEKFNASMDEFEVFHGFEAKVNNFNGDLDVSEENLARAQVRIISVHRFPIGRKLIAAKAFTPDTSQDIELELSIAAIKKGGFDIMGHPGGMSLTSHGVFSKDRFEEIVVACVDNDIAFDFNGAYHTTCAEDLLDLLEKYDPKLCVASDAHRPEHIGRGATLFENTLKEKKLLK